MDGSKEILTGDGEGSFRVFDGLTLETKLELHGLIRDAHGIVVGDVNNDGASEIVIGTGYKMDYPSGAVYIVSPANGEIVNSFEPGNASRIRGMAIVDIDGDSFNELILGVGVALGETPGEGYIYVYQINGMNITREWKSEDLNGDVEGLKVVDLDGDGKLEIIAANGYRLGPGYAFVFRHKGFDGEGTPPIFEKIWESENIGPKAYGLAVDDIDGDGINEIVIGNTAGFIWIFDGSNRELEWKSPLLGSDLLGIVLGDVDGDGQIEIVAGQGGYQGKADFTSAYTDPHIFILDGRKHTVEFALGGRDYTGWWLQIILSLLIIVLLIGVNIYISIKRRNKLVKEEKSK